MTTTAGMRTSRNADHALYSSLLSLRDGTTRTSRNPSPPCSPEGARRRCPPQGTHPATMDKYNEDGENPLTTVDKSIFNFVACRENNIVSLPAMDRIAMVDESNFAGFYTHLVHILDFDISLHL
ncbi:hypothetical protein Salat_2100100 [Sesamum alatum]|uniref:Uncharacterized protein n=1 Tax=Sesamum alatum TaxID=300844 RepID=A0AAE1Y0J7_9LAMI|nr:hypothetical protein Salat_2100100 [Sesamum alatum]